MKGFAAFLRDQPFWVELILAGVVVLQMVLTAVGWIPNVWQPLAVAKAQPQAQALYLAWLQPASIVAGFAGVVVVFGLTATSPRFAIFRARAGRSLRRTWVVSSLSGFEAVALATAATVLSIVGAAWIAPFVFELAVVILAHGACRLVWILSQLIGIVRADDIAVEKRQSVVSRDELPFNQRKAS